jgi:hypothetical protein
MVRAACGFIEGAKVSRELAISSFHVHIGRGSSSFSEALRVIYESAWCWAEMMMMMMIIIIIIIIILVYNAV